jgi:hypothetical protein
MMIMLMWWDTWTMTTNKPIVHPPGDTWAWRNMVEWQCWQGKTDSSTRALWKSYQQRHLIANRKNGQKKWEFNLAKYFCSFLQVIFTCCKLLWHGASGVTSPPKEGMLKTFFTIKNPSPWLGWNPQPPSSTENILSITPLRWQFLSLHYVSGYYCVGLWCLKYLLPS